MKLSASQVKSAKPLEKPYKLSAGRGRYLQVMANGAKYWRLKYRFAGREKLLSMGVYPAISLAEARSICDEAKALLRLLAQIALSSKYFASSNLSIGGEFYELSFR